MPTDCFDSIDKTEQEKRIKIFNLILEAKKRGIWIIVSYNGEKYLHYISPNEIDIDIDCVGILYFVRLIFKKVGNFKGEPLDKYAKGREVFAEKEQNSWFLDRDEAFKYAKENGVINEYLD